MEEQERRKKLFEQINPKQYQIKWWEQVILELFVFPTYWTVDGDISIEYKIWRGKMYYLNVKKV